MHPRLILAALALFAVPGLATSQAGAGPTDLTIVTRDETFQRALQSAYVQPFTALTLIPVQQETWDGGIDTLREHAKGGDNAWDIVLLDPDELGNACNEGLLERIDWSAVGGKDHYLAMAVTECGVGAVIANTVLAWDKDKLPVVPNWSDFWDVAKYPGKRGLRRGVRGNLEIALLADGVAPNEIYKTLATTDGVERAFRKLDQLKPYLTWWSSEAEAARILASGDVLMTSAPSGRIVTAAEKQHRGFGVQFANSLFEVQSWAVMKGAPMAKAAQQFLYFAGMPAVELRLLKTSGDSGLAKGLNDQLSPEMLAASPAAPANLAAALKVDSAFWRDNLPKLRQRFDAWVGH